MMCIFRRIGKKKKSGVVVDNLSDGGGNPIPVVGDHTFIAVTAAARQAHTLALKSSGIPWTWGLWDGLIDALVEEVEKASLGELPQYSTSKYSKVREAASVRFAELADKSISKG